MPIIQRSNSGDVFEIMNKVRQIIKTGRIADGGDAGSGILEKPDCFVYPDQSGKGFSIHSQITAENPVQMTFAVINLSLIHI